MSEGYNPDFVWNNISYSARLTQEFIANLFPTNSQIQIVWTVKDVLEVAKNKGLSLTDDECVLILESIDNNYDASIGINWNTIDFAIDSFFDN